MATIDETASPAPLIASDSRGAKAPTLGESVFDHSPSTQKTETEDKSLSPQRKLFRTGRSKEMESSAGRHQSAGPTSSPETADHLGREFQTSPHQSPGRGSPRAYARRSVASPGRRYRSTSPALHSPTSSQIFERNVQESAVNPELSPAIPAHIQTEDHIPSVLEASSLAITDERLDPDDVEIVMHSGHLPAAVTVAASSVAGETLPSPSIDDVTSAPPPPIPAMETEDLAASYAGLDTTDVKRLSFISFADVVQAEHVESFPDQGVMSGLSVAHVNRSPSPVRSPTSSIGKGVSPPTSGAASVQGLEISQPLSSRLPTSPIHPVGSAPSTNELTIETMTQAISNPASGDPAATCGRGQSLSSPTSMPAASTPDQKGADPLG